MKADDSTQKPRSIAPMTAEDNLKHVDFDEVVPSVARDKIMSETCNLIVDEYSYQRHYYVLPCK